MLLRLNNRMLGASQHNNTVTNFFFPVLAREKGPSPGFRKQFYQACKSTPLPDSVKPVGNVLGTLEDAICYLRMFTSLGRYWPKS